jgi:hypothetical protein
MNTFRIHYLQHVAYEDLGFIAQWVIEKEYKITSTKFYEDYVLPNHSTYDWLLF